MNKEGIKDANYVMLIDFVDSKNVLADSLNYYFQRVDFDEGCTFDWITRSVESNGGLNIDFCDVNNAIKYLAEEDPTLQESLAIYNKMEHPKNADSCTFASIIATDKLIGDWYSLRCEIDEFLNNLEWYEDEDEED